MSDFMGLGMACGLGYSCRNVGGSQVGGKTYMPVSPKHGKGSGDKGFLGACPAWGPPVG